MTDPTTKQPFNPKQHLVHLKGKVYLECRWRIAWFRDEHPRGCISTEIVQFEPLVVKATIYDGEGAILATAHAGAVDKGNAVWSGRAVEKAETASISRALGHAGFGTQFSSSDDGEGTGNRRVDGASDNNLGAHERQQSQRERPPANAATGAGSNAPVSAPTNAPSNVPPQRPARSTTPGSDAPATPKNAPKDTVKDEPKGESPNASSATFEAQSHEQSTTPTTGTSADESQSTGEPTREVSKEDLRDKETATRFISHWRGQGLSDAEVLGALGVAKLSLWDKGRAAADDAVGQYMVTKLRDDFTNETSVADFLVMWHKAEMSDEEVLRALGVTAFSAWTKGRDVADKACALWMSANLSKKQRAKFERKTG